MSLHIHIFTCVFSRMAAPSGPALHLWREAFGAAAAGCRRLPMCLDGLKVRCKVAGWWFGTMEFYDLPFSWEFHHPNWTFTPSFFRGVGQPPTSYWAAGRSYLLHVVKKNFPMIWSSTLVGYPIWWLNHHFIYCRPMGVFSDEHTYQKLL